MSLSLKGMLEDEDFVLSNSASGVCGREFGELAHVFQCFVVDTADCLKVKLPYMRLRA